MPLYKNKATHKVVIAGNGRLETIEPGQIVDLSTGIARRGFPYLVEVKETVQPQLLVEQPVAESLEEVVEVKEKPKKKDKKKDKKKKVEETKEETFEEEVEEKTVLEQLEDIEQGEFPDDTTDE